MDDERKIRVPDPLTPPTGWEYTSTDRGFADLAFLLTHGSMVMPGQPAEIRLRTGEVIGRVEADKPWTADKRYKIVAADGSGLTVEEV